MKKNIAIFVLLCGFLAASYWAYQRHFTLRHVSVLPPSSAHYQKYLQVADKIGLEYRLSEDSQGNRWIVVPARSIAHEQAMMREYYQWADAQNAARGAIPQH